MDKIHGLSNKEVEEQIQKGNVNTLPKDNLKSNWKIIADNVFTLFNLYNLIIAIALISVKAYTNVFFFAIIAVNVFIGIIQEIHGKNLVKKLSILNTAKATVIRNGKEKKIDVEEIVLGDTIVLAQGDQIPSDAQIISGEIEVNESLLTGESDLILKSEKDTLLSGSYVVSGKCYAKIEKVGENNFANRIISSAKKQKSNNSELINSMKKVTRFTSFVIIPFGIILFIQAYITRQTDITQSVIATAAALLRNVTKRVSLINFSVLKDVLMEGRRVVNNITSVARIFFIKTIYSILLSVFCILTNMEFPFIPIQITLIDLVIEAYTSFFISFERNEKPIKGTFLKTALTNALPFAIAIMLNIIVLTVLGNGMGIEQNTLTTMMYLLIGFVSILAVQEVCMPFNKVHAFLFSTTAVGFYVAAYLFRNLLKLSPLAVEQIGIVMILAIISYIIICIKRKLCKVL